jgi:hypothetical protein
MVFNKRKSLSLKEKVEIIQEIERTGQQATFIRRDVASSSVISRIWANRNTILEAYASKPAKTMKIKTTKYENIDEKLLLWFREARAVGIPISSPILTEKANEIARNLGITDFTCNNGWLDRFKTRHSIKSGMISGESKSVDITTVETWLNNQWPLICAGYRDEDIFNADETGLFYKCTPDTTLRFKGEPCNGGKMSKERLTVLLCSSATGEKMKPLVIGKFANPRCFKNQNLNEFNFTSNKRAWMTSSIFKSQLTQWDSKLRLQNRKIILLVDYCSSHPDINSNLTNIKLVFFPPNTTSILQPLDQGIIKNFKLNYRKILISKMLQAFEMKSQFQVSMLDALHLIKQAWDSVTANTVKNSFNHSKVVSKADSPQIAMNIEDEMRFILKCAPELFRSDGDVRTFFNIDENIISKEEVIEESEENEVEIQEIKVTMPKVNTLLEALQGLQIVKNYYIYQGISEDIDSHICKIENDLDIRYLNSKCVQKTLFDYNIIPKSEKD